MQFARFALAAFSALSILILSSFSTTAQDMPFGQPADVDYAAKLWAAMEAANYVGRTPIIATTYQGGTAPHTETVMTLQGLLSIDGVEGRVIMKKNFGPGTAEADIFKDPNKSLGMITAMFQRESGYDSDNQDWFWVAYRPDGTVNTAPNGMAIAGRFAKGQEIGCIACHSTAPGDDYVFLRDGVPLR